MRTADRITAAALLAFGVAFAAGALKYYAYWGPGGPGPAFLPFWLGVVMALLAGLMLASALKSRDPGAAWMPHGEERKRVLVVLAVTGAFVALLNVVGMVLGSALFLVVLMRFLDRNPWPLTLSVAVAAAGINYAIFTYWLRVPFPVSVLGI